ncbi:hypothetical protein I6G97_02690 [Edwardsiella hoshinae]|uniref:Uncharacterized protein n=1 Tax=Edwardsiella hoshinae TaxID=93378 RepID=A0A376D5G4_9GAMM|nr:hypothetical protein [Edwardsiella hoshinae]QPR28569.1 hypothetical protein I6G97_02690 [Edwardsiella hoshinae]STC82792.1 Uncharacterised protein [Edwardsiella hoshinae]
MAKDAYWLVKDFSRCSADEAKECIAAASGTRESLINGIGVIGKLLFIAGTSDDAADEVNNSDIALLGDFISKIARLHEGISLAESNLNFAIKTKLSFAKERNQCGEVNK